MPPDTGTPVYAPPAQWHHNSGAAPEPAIHAGAAPHAVVQLGARAASHAHPGRAKHVDTHIGERIPNFRDTGSVFAQLFPALPWVRQRAGDPVPVPFTSEDLWDMLSAVPLTAHDHGQKWAAVMSLFQAPEAVLRTISLDAGVPLQICLNDMTRRRFDS